MASWLPQLPSHFAHRFRVKVGGELTPTVDLTSSPFHLYLIHRDREQLLRDYEAVTHRMSEGFVLASDPG